MGNKLYVGNLPLSASSNYLEEAFSSCGQVENVKMIIDKITGRPNGFALVEMGNQTEVQSVINKYNGTDYEGKLLKISKAKPMQKRSNNNRPKKGW